MLVLPGHLRLSKSLLLGRARRGVRDLGDEIRRGCLCHTIKENPNEGGLQHNGESKGETKQDALTVGKPTCPLLTSKGDAAKVRIELVAMLDMFDEGKRLDNVPSHA